MCTVRILFSSRNAQYAFLDFMEHLLWLRERLEEGGWPSRRDVRRELVAALERLLDSTALDRVCEIAQ